MIDCCQSCPGCVKRLRCGVTKNEEVRYFIHVRACRGFTSRLVVLLSLPTMPDNSSSPFRIFLCVRLSEVEGNVVLVGIPQKMDLPCDATRSEVRHGAWRYMTSVCRGVECRAMFRIHAKCELRTHQERGGLVVFSPLLGTPDIVSHFREFHLQKQDACIKTRFTVKKVR